MNINNKEMKRFLKQKKNKAYPAKLQRSGGFVILFVMVISSIVLAVTLAIANISYKEIMFSTSAKDTNDAFFAADTGAECALNYDKTAPVDNAFTGTASMNCAGSSITLNGSNPNWNFIVSGLGSNGQGCAKVTVDKSISPLTTIIAKGYNNGGSVVGSCTQGLNNVERQIELTY